MPRHAVCFLLLLLVVRAAQAGGPRVRDFEANDATREEWVGPAGEKRDIVTIDARHGESLSIPVSFPAPAQVWRGSREAPRRLFRYDPLSKKPAAIVERLRYEVYLPPGKVPAGARVQCRVVLKSKDGFWFEALGERRTDDGRWVPATALHPGWNVLRVDLSDSSTQLRPRGHRMRWSRFFLSQVAAIGFSIQGDKPFAGAVALDNIATWTVTDDEFAPLTITRFDPGAETAAQYETAEFTFGINRPLLNPFAQREITIDAEFRKPDGGTVRVPAFYYQPYRREKGVDTGEGALADRYTPTGPGVFKLRFTPRQVGEYRYRLVVRYRSPVRQKEELLETEERTLTVTARPDRGFVRISPTDSRCFEFENGDYFYPVGHSFRSPTDARHVRRILEPYFPSRDEPGDRGLRVYEDMLPVMEKHGVNTFEVWMASWWLGIEWTGRWKNYHGLGVYNMEHAWKLDRLLDLAAENGQYVHLVIDNHGKAAQDLKQQKRHRGRAPKGQVDQEWEFSPYNAENVDDGGFLQYSKDLFSDERAREYYRDKIRYIAARWGYSPNIFGIEMWSELDLIGHEYGRHRNVYASPEVHAWHKEMTGVLRENDHGNHLITTHYSGDWQYIDRTMVGFPFIDYITCDAYHNRKKHLTEMLMETEDLALRYDKPFLVTEFGGDWNASSREGLDGDFQAGLWWSWMSRTAGVPFYWWFEYIALKDELRNKESFYKYYQAFSRFIDGEDKRRAPGEPQLRSQWRAGVRDEKRLHVLSLGDGNAFYVWVHDRDQIQSLPTDPGEYREYEGATLVIADAEPGVYAVESWECWTGRVVDKFEQATTSGNEIEIPLPRFRVQVAVKVKRIPGRKPPRRPNPPKAESGPETSDDSPPETSSEPPARRQADMEKQQQQGR